MASSDPVLFAMTRNEIRRFLIAHLIEVGVSTTDLKVRRAIVHELDEIPGGSAALDLMVAELDAGNAYVT